MSKEASTPRLKVSEMNAEQRAAYEKRVAASRAPKPLYIAYKIVDANGEAIEGATLAGVTCTRSADDLIKAISADRDTKHIMTEVK